MAIFNVVTFLIRAIAGAFASLLAAVFTHLLPAIVAVVALLALLFAVCTSCGIGGVALVRRRGKRP